MAGFRLRLPIAIANHVALKAKAAESCAGEEEEDAKASSLSKPLELGSLFGLWFLFNIYFNIYNRHVDDCSLSSLPLPWKRRTQDHHSKLPSIAHHNLHFYLLLLGNLEGIWMGKKRGREQEKKMATTQPICLGIASDFALYVAESVGFYVFPLRKNTAGWRLSLLQKLYCYLGDADRGLKPPKGW